MTVQFFAFNKSIADTLKTRITPEALSRPFVKADGSMWTPSRYQEAIFDWVARGKGSAIVKAVAGSGKTTTGVASLSFIRHVQAKDIRASTFHSVGYGAILKRLNVRPDQITVKGDKVRKLSKDVLGEVEYAMYSSFSSKLVGFAKGRGIGPLVPDVIDEWYNIIQHHDLYLEHEQAKEERGIEIARNLLDESNKQGLRGIIDFDDQLYLPLLWRCKLWQNDWVIVDESQDTNPVRRAIAKLALRPGGRLVAFGDEKQSIYQFTGASSDAMELIRQEFNCIELPLTVSYRCPKSVAQKVQALVPYFEVPETAPEGEVKQMAQEEAIKLLGPQDAILCRQTAPLIGMAFKLIGQGIGCHVLGKEIGVQLIELIKKQKATDIDSLISRLETYQEREVTKYTAKGEEDKADAVSDRVASIFAVIEALEEDNRTINALVSNLESLFSDDNGVLTLATVHKVKGKEYRRVAILQPELMPSKWARQEHQFQQELNIQYVAWSRATEMLIEMVE